MKEPDHILSINPYQPGLSINEVKKKYKLKNIYKMASNENPLGPSPKSLKAIKNELKNLHYYPEGRPDVFLNEFSKQLKISKDEIYLANGSDEIIETLIKTYVQKNENIVIPQYSFISYLIRAKTNNIQFRIAKSATLGFDFQEIKNSIDNNTRLLFLANPNNPTGLIFGYEKLLDLLEFTKYKNILIIIDEAYHHFVKTNKYCSSIGFIKKYSQLCILRTFSKVYGLAGIRLGVLISRQSTIEILNRVRQPFNVNSLAPIAAYAALKDKSHVIKSQKLVWDGLKYFKNEFNELKINMVETQGNFFLIELNNNSKIIFEKMLEKGFVLRPVEAYGLEKYLRISVDKMNVNKKMMIQFKQIYGELNASKRNNN